MDIVVWGLLRAQNLTQIFQEHAYHPIQVG